MKGLFNRGIDASLWRRNFMRQLRPIRTTKILAFLAVAAIVAFLCALPNILNPQYFGLRHKSAEYYIELTRACDSVIASHPVGEKDFVNISVTDPSLPKVITDLHPIKIAVSRERFWMLLGSDSHLGFGLSWNPDWGNTNTWVLHTTAESKDTVIYSAGRGLLANTSR